MSKDLDDMVENLFGDDLDDRLEQQVANSLHTIRERRDELRVKLHLAAADAKDEWEEIENKWHKLVGKLKVVADDADEATQDVRQAVRLLGEEIADAYRSFTKRVS